MSANSKTQPPFPFLEWGYEWPMLQNTYTYESPHSDAMNTEAPKMEESQQVEAVVDTQVDPEIQSILDEVEQELNDEAKGALKKTIRERLKKLRRLRAELAREEATFAALVQMKKPEIEAFASNRLLCAGESDSGWPEGAIKNWSKRVENWGA